MNNQQLIDQAHKLWSDILARGFYPINSDGTRMNLSNFIQLHIENKTPKENNTN